ncbi:AAA family ATPase [Clostridium saudiense]|uniref:AAA family ATPase n=2 Tax=Clostridium saudiense TaxID=1414720 RepID=UPI0004B271B4|nr:AAA family ATPase [Clostridium saudiense]
MFNFYIKELSLSGDNVETSSLEFTSGLNIICGPSNTGKSYIAECLDFMFGCKAKDFRIGKETGYNIVRMKIVTANGDIYLEKKFDENNIQVNSFNPNIDSGRYSRTKSKLYISNLWLNLMGIHNPPEIIKKETFERQVLTLRSFLHTFFIEEDNVFQENSIMFQKSNFTSTAILSIILFLITSDSFKDANPQEEKKIKEARKNAVIKYINDNLNNLAVRKNELIKTETQNIETIQAKINSTLDEIAEAEGEISIAVTRSKFLSNEIYALAEQLAECNMLHSRYKALRSQYRADIKRLTFIVEGELHKEEIPESLTCPFCDGALPKLEDKTCIEAAHIELQKIILQMKDLDDAEKDIISEKLILEERNKELIIERSKIELLINSELQPRVDSLRKSLYEYKRSIEINNESSIIQRFESNMIADLTNIQVTDDPEAKYKPREYFTQDILNKLNEILTKILESCKFEEFSSAYFSLDPFDVVVNGKAKFTFGKGYRAFLNTAVALTFKEYLSEYDEFSPGMLIIDSPILSLKEKSDEKASDSMKSSLFKYLVDNQNSGQTIIIENDIPDIDYSKVNVIKFTKDKNNGRYGFFKEIK